MGMGVTMGIEFPWDSHANENWILNEDGNGNTTAWEREQLMLVRSQNQSSTLRYTLCSLFAAFTQRP